MNTMLSQICEPTTITAKATKKSVIKQQQKRKMEEPAAYKGKNNTIRIPLQSSS